MSDYLDPNNEELLKDFFAEADMQVEMLEQNILVLEHDTGNAEAIDEIFRAAHTLKGASATVQMNELASFTHIMEDVLDDIRSGKIQTSAATIDLLLEAIDVIKAMLTARADGAVYEEDVSGLKNRLHALIDSKASPASKAKPAQVKEAPKPAPSSSSASPSDISEYDLLEMKDAADGVPIFEVKVFFDKNNPMNSVGGIQVFAALKDLGQVLKTNPDFDALYSDEYHPTVSYYLSSAKDTAHIGKVATIADVTTKVDVIALSTIASPAKAAPARSSISLNPDEVNKVLSVDTTTKSAPSPSSNNAIEKALAQASATLEEKDEDEQAPLAQKASGEPRKSSNAGGSILRVESRRIDELLNLVSETVINKATFNQVSNNFTDLLNNFQNIQSEYRQTIKQLFDAIPEYLERVHRGHSVKDVKRELTERFGNISAMYDPVTGSLKSTIGKFKSTAQNLGRITGELQEGVMRIRMVPISQIFSRFPRLVRDVSKQVAKDINLIIEGEDTELDKSVIEDLLDPLIHCVRNAIDHGIESPEARRKAGKPERGEVMMKASNEGNMILIEIADDGKGIDVESVRNKAIERGIIHPNKALSDVEAFQLIFDPGFSTASQITSISGRGVGLDVVKKSIEKLNGNVTVTSERGKGTRFIIKIPLTLAIIQGLLVRVGTEIYAIPITAVLDSHRIKPEDIRMIDNYEVFNVRDDVVSLMRLSRIFRIPTDEQKEHFFVVIVGSGEKKMGLIVDALIGEEDVVIKPLRDHYTNAPGIAGANITGDGTVSLIIDVSQLLELGQNREIEARRQREMAFK